MGTASTANNSANKLKRWGPACLILAGFGLAVLIATGKPKPQAGPLPPKTAPQVEVSTAKVQPRHLQIESQGTLESRREARLTAEVSGTVIATSDHFARGQALNKGDLLVQIDPRDFEIALAEASAQVADARQLLATERGRARQAKREWRDLGSQEANDLFLRKPQLASAEAALAAAEAKLQRAKLNLERTTVTAPFAGVISQVDAQLGQFLPVGGNVGTLTDTTQLELKLPVSSRELKLMPKVADGIETHLLAEDGSKLLHTRITRMQPTADPQSRFHYLIGDVQLKDDNISFYAGQFVDARLQGREFPRTISIVQQALRGRDQIWLIDANDTLQIAHVKVLQQNADDVIVAVDTKQPELDVITSYIARPEHGMPLTRAAN